MTLRVCFSFNIHQLNTRACFSLYLCSSVFVQTVPCLLSMSVSSTFFCILPDFRCHAAEVEVDEGVGAREARLCLTAHQGWCPTPLPWVLAVPHLVLWTRPLLDTTEETYCHFLKEEEEDGAEGEEERDGIVGATATLFRQQRSLQPLRRTRSRNHSTQKQMTVVWTTSRVAARDKTLVNVRHFMPKYTCIQWLSWLDWVAHFLHVSYCQRTCT